jgi:SAM-dependent methyltransferase
MDKQFWDDRYGESEYAYGITPNLFFAQQVQKFRPGSILMPADGEGRNGVFAAALGWRVTSCDLSNEGSIKALALAEIKKVSIEYIVGDLEGLQFEPESFDAVGLIYAHFPALKKSKLHAKLDACLRPGGTIILEAFSKDHLKFNSVNPKAGGPKETGILYSEAELREDFPNYNFMLLEEKELDLAEGRYHIGRSAVVQFVGIKQ